MRCVIYIFEGGTMTQKQINRYNELLLHFIKDEKFMELVDLVAIYHASEHIKSKQSRDVFIENPYERLVFDLENREKILGQ